MLGLTKALRVSKGFAYGGNKKPHAYRQVTRGLFYNLADQQHLRAFLTTFSRLTAMSAMITDRPGLYGLELGQRRFLSKVTIPGQGIETLELLCENGNYREPSNRVFARNKQIRDEAKLRHKRLCSPIKQYTFVVHREQDIEGTINGGSELRIPLESVERLASAIDGLLHDVWEYVGEHRDQVELRYDHPDRVRWQLHHPPALDWLIPRLSSALSFKAEPALFESPELYAYVPRVQEDGSYHPRYVRKLLAYARGDLRWRSSWDVSELEAQRDLSLMYTKLYKGIVGTLRKMVLVYLLCLSMRYERKHNPSNFGVPLSWDDCWSFECRVSHPPRGPPTS